MSDAYPALAALVQCDAGTVITDEVQVQLRAILDEHRQLTSDNVGLKTRVTALEADLVLSRRKLSLVEIGRHR